MSALPPSDPAIAYSSPASLPRRLSKSSLLSFICGILGCLPLVTGALAIVFGIVGLVRTGSPLKKGRWMAVVGLILGLISVITWTAVLGTVGFVGATGWAFLADAMAPGNTAHQFMRDIADGDLPAARSLEQGIGDPELQADRQQLAAHGKLLDTSFNNISITNGACDLSGTAKFDTGDYDLTVHLQKLGTWKVTQFNLSHDKQ